MGFLLLWYQFKEVLKYIKKIFHWFSKKKYSYDSNDELIGKLSFYQMNESKVLSLFKLDKH